MERDLKNSIDYINKKTSKETGFSIPKNYLNNFEDTIAIKLAEVNIPKEHCFETPKNYFNNLEDSILSKISIPKKEIKVISFKDRVLKMVPYAAAASVILFIGLNTSVFNKSEENIFDKLADSEVENWISNNIDLISSSDIALTYNDIEFDDLETIPNSITDDDLEDYLNNKDETSLILEND